MTTLPIYKGFQGSVEYDDGVLLVRILHIEDFVSATCDSAVQAPSIFRELVDDYIRTCEEAGDEPNPPFKGSFDIRVKPEVHRGAAMAAAVSDMTLNAWVEAAMNEKLQRDKADFEYYLQDVDVASIEQRALEARIEPRAARSSEEAVANLDEYREALNQKRKAGR